MTEIRYRDIFFRGLGYGGIESCYMFPEWKFAFDIGRCPYDLVDIPLIFLSHGHLDHAAGLAYYLGQRCLKNLSLGKIYLPEKLIEPMKEILKIWQKIEGFEYDILLNPINEKSEVRISKDLVMTSIPSFHRVPSQGYVLHRESKKLRPEFLDLPGKEIRKKKDAGEKIFYYTKTPLVCYSGDSTIEFILENEVACQARVLILECTYIDQARPVSRARAWGHIHLDEIIEHQSKFENELLVLTHFSRRYSRRIVKSIIEQKVSEEFKKKIRLFL